MALAKSFYKQVVGIVFSITAIAALALIVDWSLVWVELKAAHYEHLVLCFVVFWLHYWLRALRWRFLLPPNSAKLELGLGMDALWVGSLVTFVLPLRAGEFARAWFITLGKRFAFSTSFSSIIVERLFDLSCVLFAFGLMVYSVDSVPQIIYWGAFLLALLGLVMFASILLALFWPRLLVRFISRMITCIKPNWHDSTNGILLNLLAGLESLRNPKTLVIVILLSFVVWLMNFVFASCFALVVGLPFSLTLGIAVTVIVALAVAAPSSPGFLGIMQAGCILALGLFGISKEKALAYSVLMHAFQYLAFVIFGLRAFWKNRISWGDLGKARAGHNLA